MAGLEQLALELLGQTYRKPDFAAEDPYLQFGNMVTDPISQTLMKAAPSQDYSTGEKIGLAAITGLLGGGASALSDDYQSRTRDAYSSVIADALLKRPLARPDDLTPSLFDSAKEAASLFDVADALEERTLEREIGSKTKLAGVDFENDLAKLALSEIAKNPRQAERIIGSLPPSVTKKLGYAVSNAVPDTEPIAKSADSLSPNRGIEGTLADQISLETNRLIEAGVPETQAAVTAREIYGAKKSELDRQYKRVEEAEKAAKDLSNMTNAIEYALQGAGDTGFAGQAKQTLAGILGTVSDEQKAKYAAGQDVESFAADIVRSARQVGSGPMSDRDVKIYLSSGPSLAKEESANAAILDRWRYTAGLQEKYAAFMRGEQAKGTPVSEAESKWTTFTKENPFFVRDGGELKPNPVWQGGQPTVKTDGSKTEATESTSASVPQVGSTFNGEKVVSVRRVK